MAFALSANLVREGKNMSPNFKKIVRQRLKLLNILIRIVKSILSPSFKQFHQTLYSNNLCIVDRTCYLS